jgi:hypothetical protein
VEEGEGEGEKKQARPSQHDLKASPEEQTCAARACRAGLLELMNANVARAGLNAYRRTTTVDLARDVVLIE